ncbi:slit homolog 1 protein-like isoform X2 [Mytilus californianus]|nr:slit homolog 1 protein-like isoform X2 [Mytilus californianus]XP_052062870.1 slit homolog 1 protein-like isoform X2 [Mytilus californianus]
MKNASCFLFAVLVVCAKLVNTSCPYTCSCSNSTSGFSVNCNFKSFEHIPVLPNDTYYLNFAYNSIQDIDVQFCKEMPLLQNINIHNNLIQEIPDETFTDCHQLITLNLHNNRITDIPRDTFSNLSQLQTLYLYNNKIQSIESYTFVNMTNLNRLSLYSNEISTIKQSAFMNLPSLQYLYLYNNKIRSIESNTFVNMTNLYELYLHNNELTSIVEYTFVNLPSLYYLDLSGNNISLIEEHALGNLTQLSTLNLASNPINCDCSIFPFWSWIIERASIGISAKCSDGKFVISLRSAELEKCNPDNCRCFNGGKCITSGDGKVVCDCIGEWTGEFCQESQCMTYDCGFGNCFVEPMNGTAQCVCGNKQPTYCPGKRI